MQVAVSKYADELDMLSTADRELLKSSINDILRQTPQQSLAEHYIKKLAPEMGPEAVAALRALLHNAIAQAVLQRLFGG